MSFCLRPAGRLFHSLGPAAMKHQSPKLQIYFLFSYFALFLFFLFALWCFNVVTFEKVPELCVL